MSGTIVIGPTKIMDVRTVDFVSLGEALRNMKGRSRTAKKLLESVDEYGMNMICADELAPTELREFDQLVQEIGAVLPTSGEGLAEYLNDVHALIISDERYIRSEPGDALDE